MIPQSVMPVVFLEGTDYEMGFQYGEQLADYVSSACTAAWVHALGLGDSRHPTAPSRDAVLRDVHVYRDLLAQHMPEQLDQIRGMSDALKRCGKSTSELDLLLVQSGVNRRLAAEASVRDDCPSVKSCSTWSAWGSTTRHGELICSDSYDGDFSPQVCLVAFPREGEPYVTTAAIGELSSHFAYSFKGLFFGNSGGNGRRLIDWGYGLRWTSVIQHCVRFARNVEEACGLIGTWPHALPENYHLVDKSRNGAVVELTAESQCTRRPGDHGETDFLYSTNNFMCPEMQAACDVQESAQFVPYGGWPGNAGVPRNLEIRQLLTRYAGHVDLAFAKMMWRFPGDAPLNPPKGGWSNMICRMCNNRVAIVLPDQGSCGTFHICTGPVGRTIYQFRSSTFPVQGTHTFVEVPLRETPDEIVEQMLGLARDDIAMAHHALARLSVQDAGFFGLREIKAVAHEAFYGGKHSFYQALEMPSDSNRLRNLSRAASQFALCQALSGELGELIAPPPTSPDQMGLVPWQQEYLIKAEQSPGFPKGSHVEHRLNRRTRAE